MFKNPISVKHVHKVVNPQDPTAMIASTIRFPFDVKIEIQSVWNVAIVRLWYFLKSGGYVQKQWQLTSRHLVTVVWRWQWQGMAERDERRAGIWEHLPMLLCNKLCWKFSHPGGHLIEKHGDPESGPTEVSTYCVRCGAEVMEMADGTIQAYDPEYDVDDSEPNWNL